MAAFAHLLAVAVLFLARIAVVLAEDGLPSYQFSSPIHVECMNRSS
jgi:hypothetical protein